MTCCCTCPLTTVVKSYFACLFFLQLGTLLQLQLPGEGLLPYIPSRPHGLLALRLAVSVGSGKHAFALLQSCTDATIESKIQVAVVSSTNKINVLTNKFKMPPQLPIPSVLIPKALCRNAAFLPQKSRSHS